MNSPPRGQGVPCPECGNIATAIIPTGSELVEEEEHADGKVWVNCHECGIMFLTYYRSR